MTIRDEDALIANMRFVLVTDFIKAAGNLPSTFDLASMRNVMHFVATGNLAEVPEEKKKKR